MVQPHRAVLAETIAGRGFWQNRRFQSELESHPPILVSPVKIPQMRRWTSVFDEALRDLYGFVAQLLIGFIHPHELKRVCKGCLSLLHTRDDVGTPDPVGLIVIGFGPLGRVVGMGMVEAHDVFSALPPFALDAHQVFGVDVIAIVRGIGAGIAAARGARHYARTTVFKSPKKHPATFMRIGLFAVVAYSVILSAGEFKHFGVAA